MKRKIKPGDWVMTKGGVAFQVDDVTSEMAKRLAAPDSGEWHDAAACTRLPASPAILAKSHRLLLRWYRAKGNRQVIASERAVYAHAGRSLTPKGKRGKGEGK